MTIAIVGSGIAAAMFVDRLTSAGHAVTVIEKGPDYPYPHLPQFTDRVHLVPDKHYSPPPDLYDLVQPASYPHPINIERKMRLGGTATVWTGIALRFRPDDFQLRSRHGVGVDWPIGYAELEPYYSEAERVLGVSGEPNPFDPPRSQPFPLPAFELAYDDKLIAARLEKDGIKLHTTAQARTRLAYDGRPGCQNFGMCQQCPIGVRYSPNHHLKKALSTGLVTLRLDTSVRRLVFGPQGRVVALVCRQNDTSKDEEIPVKAVVLAAGALETSRLLLLSRTAGVVPSGLGEHVGRHLLFHHLHFSSLHYDEDLWTGRVGPPTGSSHQFIEHDRRAAYGGIKIEFGSLPLEDSHVPSEIASTEAALVARRELSRCRTIAFHSETLETDDKFVTLASKTDRFSDPFAEIRYRQSNYDAETFGYAQRLYDRFKRATGAVGGNMATYDRYSNGHHHMGGCRMARSERDGVTNSKGQVFGSANLFLGGSSVFATSSAVNPTLTIAALSLRSAKALLEQLGA